MFVISQNGNISLRVETIDKLVAVKPNYTEALPPEANARKKPMIVAITGRGEEVIGEYESITDCRVAIDFVSYLINKNSSKIYMPKKDEVNLITSKFTEMKKIDLQKNANDLVGEILKYMGITHPGNREGGIR